MKIQHFFFLLFSTALFESCAEGKEVKTLYGLWEPVLEYADSSGKWIPSTGNFTLTVSGKCEEIEVTKMEKGDLANPDIPMTNSKCFGNRDELSFVDAEDHQTTYLLKMDASKDTLTGTATSAYSNLPEPYVSKIKFARVGSK